jgi:hypothetical protein
MIDDEEFNINQYWLMEYTTLTLIWSRNAISEAFLTYFSIQHLNRENKMTVFSDEKICL